MFTTVYYHVLKALIDFSDLLYIAGPGVIPSPVHLEDVQLCLLQIQQILIELQKFWENVRTLLDSMKDQSFVEEDLFQDLKEGFLTSIKATGKVM